MTTTTETTSTTILDTDAYVAHGAFDEGTMHAAHFRALGGTSMMVHPSWRFGTDGPMLVATGTPEAVAFVEATLAA